MRISPSLSLANDDKGRTHTHTHTHTHSHTRTLASLRRTHYGDAAFYKRANFDKMISILHSNLPPNVEW